MSLPGSVSSTGLCPKLVDHFRGCILYTLLKPAVTSALLPTPEPTRLSELSRQLLRLILSYDLWLRSSSECNILAKSRALCELDRPFEDLHLSVSFKSSYQKSSRHSKPIIQVSSQSFALPSSTQQCLPLCRRRMVFPPMAIPMATSQNPSLTVQVRQRLRTTPTTTSAASPLPPGRSRLVPNTLSSMTRHDASYSKSTGRSGEAIEGADGGSVGCSPVRFRACSISITSASEAHRQWPV